MFASVMIKKQFILSLALLFFVSTTGLPLYMHLCKMNGTFTADECGMCVEEKQPVKKSCCEAENEYDVAFKTDSFYNCCETTLVDASVKDKYISAKVDKKEDSNSLTLLPQLNHSIDFSASQEVIFYSDSSPPHLISNDLYLTNSIFLI